MAPNVMTTIQTDKQIISFLRRHKVDPDEYDSWISCYRTEEPDGDYSFKEYFHDCNAQMRMFSSIDWNENDSEVSRQLSQAYFNSL